MFMTASAICTAKNMEFRLPVRSGVGTMISVILPWNTEEKGESPDDKDDIGG